MKVISVFILLLATSIAINLRRNEEGLEPDTQMKALKTLENDANVKDLESEMQILVAQDQSACVTVFAECNFGGSSANVCQGSLANVAFPIASVRAPQGYGISIQIGVVAINLFGSITCISEPLNQERQQVAVSVLRPASI